MSEDNGMSVEAGAVAGPGSEGGEAGLALPENWKDAVPAEIRNQPALARIKDVPSLARSYLEAQRLVGADKIALPREGDEKAWNAVYDRLGRPAAPEKYELPMPKGATADGELESWARSAFHEAGLTGRQARVLAEKWNEMAAGRAQSMHQDSALKSAADLEGLEQTWGKAYDQKLAAGQRAARRFGDPETLDKLEAAMGTAGVMELMARIGEALTEDGLEGEGGDRFALTPAQARAEIDRMMGEPESVKALGSRLHPGHQAAMERKRQLFKLAYPG